MDKMAQRSGKRSLLNKIRESTNISGAAAEKIFNPEFQRVMDSLRESDNRIRAIVSGKDIEGIDPGDDPIALKELYKNAKSNINRREYMTAIAFLGRFHKKLSEINNIIKELNVNVDKVHDDFLFKDLNEDQKKYLHDLKSRFASRKAEITKEANIMDFLTNIGTERGRALAAWEKRYPRQVGKLKKDSASLLNKTESVLDSILSTLRDMAKFRAERKVDNYVKSASKLTSLYSNYDRVFRDFYNDNVKNFLEKQELIAPVKPVENKDLGKQEVKVENPATLPSSNIPDLEVPDKVKSTKPSNKNDSVIDVTEHAVSIPPSLPSVPKSAPRGFSDLEDLERQMLAAPKLPTRTGPTTPPPSPFTSEELEEVKFLENEEDIASSPTQPAEETAKTAHAQFYKTLQKLANEDPRLMANFIRKYANSIKKSDFETSIKLLKIANSMGS